MHAWKFYFRTNWAVTTCTVSIQVSLIFISYDFDEVLSTSRVRTFSRNSDTWYWNIIENLLLLTYFQVLFGFLCLIFPSFIHRRTSFECAYMKCKFCYCNTFILPFLPRFHIYGFWWFIQFSFCFDYSISVAALYIWISKHIHFGCPCNLKFDLLLKQRTSNAIPNTQIVHFGIDFVVSLLWCSIEM